MVVLVLWCSGGVVVQWAVSLCCGSTGHPDILAPPAEGRRQREEEERRGRREGSREGGREGGTEGEVREEASGMESA